MPTFRFLLAIHMLWALAVPNSWASEVELKGRCLEELQWNGDYFVEFSPPLGIAFRYKEDKQLYLIVEPAEKNSSCGIQSGHIVVDSLSMEKETKNTWFAVNFDCSNKIDVATGDAIVGLFQGKGLGPSLKAWKIDPHRKQFMRVKNVVCKSFS